MLETESRTARAKRQVGLGASDLVAGSLAYFVFEQSVFDMPAHCFGHLSLSNMPVPRFGCLSWEFALTSLSPERPLGPGCSGNCWNSGSGCVHSLVRILLPATVTKTLSLKDGWVDVAIIGSRHVRVRAHADFQGVGAKRRQYWIVRISVLTAPSECGQWRR